MVERLACENLVLKRIRPSKIERDHICGVAHRLLNAINATGEADGMVVGSIARNTWIKGDRDLDIFLLFPPSLSHEGLKEKGLSLAHSIASLFTEKFCEKYAEHPYINALIDDIDVDLVPCYAVETATKIQSSVDRTPFHTRYIADKINGRIDDVLLLKQFTKAGGIYGSDQMTEGFSGYLCELLVLYYGGFAPLLEAVTKWRPGTIIDIEQHAAKSFSEPLIVIDPVDPKRNVAASVSLDRMVEFIELSRGYLNEPSEAFFILSKEYSLTKNQLVSLLKKRGTYLFAITFATPPYIEEIIVPQLKRSATSIRQHLERNGFDVHHADYFMQSDRCMLLFELLTNKLPKIRHHTGPPLWNRTNADKFFEKHIADKSSGPYIKDGRYEVEVPREFAYVKELLSSPSLLNVSLGRHVRQSFEHGWTINEGALCWQKTFAPFIAGFFDRCSPLSRIKRDR
ncbi:MAG: CCA tRNA nucleotidyltransferase [Methanoregulaceae archaeon]|jgi:tRNA nucleotidyltransferase (CCA-adding enzyme)